jgi:hypothetical protein
MLGAQLQAGKHGCPSTTWGCTKETKVPGPEPRLLVQGGAAGRLLRTAVRLQARL